MAEYVLGLLLVAQGLQSPAPLGPSLAGGLVVMNAAIVRGAPLSAFRLVSRTLHRVLDVVVIAVIVLLIVQPWIEVIPADRLIMAGIVVVMGFVWLNSNFAEKVPRAQRKTAATAATPQTAGTPTSASAPTTATGTGTPLPPPTGEPVDTGSVGGDIGRKAGRLVGNGINAAKRYGKR
ncbi:MAG: hypothetical protein RLZZ362_2198 [Actinomycetota bacterium]